MGAQKLGVIVSVFLAYGFDLLDQRVDLFRCQLAGVLRHAAFAVGDDVAEVSRRCGSGFVGDERWPTEVAALGRFTVTLRAVCLEDGVRNQGRVSWRGLGEDCCE